MRDLATIYRDYAANGKRMKDVADYGRDSEYNRLSDRHWVLLAELNDALKAAGRPMAHQLSNDEFQSLAEASHV